MRSQPLALRLPDKISHDSLPNYAAGLLEAAKAYPLTGLLREDLRLPALDLTAWFASRDLADLCGRTLICRPNDSLPVIQSEIFAMDATLDGWEPPAGWDEGVGFSSREFERILDAAGLRGFYYHEAPSWQFFDPAKGIGVQSLPRPLAFAPWESASPLRLFLHWAYAASGRRLTHAATLGLDGHGALIVGQSGSGKSATALAGLSNGLESAGDDYVMLEAHNRITAHAVFRLVKQDRRGLRRMGVAHPRLDTASPNWHGKIEFDPVEAGLPALTQRMEITAVLLPAIAGLNRTTFERVSARSAALALAPSAVLQLPGDTNEGFRFFTEIVRRLPAYRVNLSQDPAEIAGAIGGLLARGSNLAG